jgi:AcrR family transcriptional regulator
MSEGYPKGRQRRQKIFEAANRILERDGYEAVTLRAVASGADLSLAGVHHHFRSRAALLTALLVERDEVGLRSVGGATVRELFDDVRRAVLEATRSAQVGQLYIHLAAQSVDPAHPSREFFEARYRRLDDAGEELLLQLVAAGVLPEGVKPSALAGLLRATMDGLQIRRLHEPGFDITPVLDALEGLIQTARTVEHQSRRAQQ